MSFRKRGGDRPRPSLQVDAVAEGRSLPAGRLTDPDDADALRAAIELRAAAPAAGLPSEEFVKRLRGQLEEETRPGGDSTAGPRLSRRALVAGAGAAAVAGVAGVVADRATVDSRHGTEQATVQPNEGTWVRVAARADLEDGSAHRFETTTAVGFVTFQGTELLAVSGACTHQGCLLQADGTAGRLDCPCHRTSFGYGGDVLFSQLSPQPAPLPRLLARREGDGVEVFLPKPPA